MPTDWPSSRCALTGRTQPRSQAVSVMYRSIDPMVTRAVPRLLDDAIALAEPVLRANPAADLREVVGRRRQLVGLFEAPLGGQLEPIGYVVVDRAMNLTERHATLRAAPSLRGGPRRVEFIIDLAKIMAPVRGFALRGH